jgi:hypothetical protein
LKALHVTFERELELEREREREREKKRERKKERERERDDIRKRAFWHNGFWVLFGQRRRLRHKGNCTQLRIVLLCDGGGRIVMKNAAAQMRGGDELTGLPLNRTRNWKDTH